MDLGGGVDGTIDEVFGVDRVHFQGAVVPERNIGHEQRVGLGGAIEGHGALNRNGHRGGGRDGKEGREHDGREGEEGDRGGKMHLCGFEHA